MNFISKASVLLSVVMALVVCQLAATGAFAQSSYWTSRGCVNCHAAPVAATCAGCHQHSGTLTATKNKTTSYAPGETVTITLTASGARSGWIGVRLYDQAGAEIARSAGNQSGMGGSATYPAVLSAPAPATAGTYTWRIAYFGNNNGTGTGDVHSEKSVNVAITVASAIDATAPVVSAFTLPATAAGLTVPVNSLTATDNVAVTAYLITTSATQPAANATGWSATAPTSVTAPTTGTITFYAWARDAAGNISSSASAVITIAHKAIYKDFDGDGKSDMAVWHPNDYNWFILDSATTTQRVVNYGASGDSLVPGDYDGDGKTDIAVWRPAEGNWYIMNSATATQRVVNYGVSGDIPVSSDYDGDGKADIAVWRPADGNWYVMNSATATQRVINYGVSGDIPVPGDYDGDGKTDIAVWRPADGNWYIMNSATTTQRVINYGVSGDVPVPGDYDGDGRTDIAVWRPADGKWYIMNSATNTQSIVTFGALGDTPVPGDYDGIGRTETAVWRPAEGNWYVMNSAAQTQRIVQFGIPADKPVK